MVSTVTTNRGEVLVQRDQVERLLGQLAELLDDIADADADSSWGLPAVPTDAIPDQVADLCGRMQMLFFLEETDETLAELIEMQPELRDELERLHCEHPRLLNLLEEIRELAGPSLVPLRLGTMSNRGFTVSSGPCRAINGDMTTWGCASTWRVITE